jgi:hypothetical protein
MIILAKEENDERKLLEPNLANQFSLCSAWKKVTGWTPGFFE